MKAIAHRRTAMVLKLLTLIGCVIVCACFVTYVVDVRNFYYGSVALGIAATISTVVFSYFWELEEDANFKKLLVNELVVFFVFYVLYLLLLPPIVMTHSNRRYRIAPAQTRLGFDESVAIRLTRNSYAQADEPAIVRTASINRSISS